MSSVATGTAQRTAGLATAVALAVFAVAIAVAYQHTLARIVPNWLQLQGVLSHGLLMVALIGSVWWTRRAAILGDGQGAPVLLVLAAFVAGCVWFAGWLTDLDALQILALFAVCATGGAALVARPAVGHLVAPFVLILFSLPIWSTLVPVLQLAATRVAGGVFQAADMIVYIEGNQVGTPNGTFEVADSCSGLGFLLVALSITGWLALTHECSRARLVLIAVASLAMGLVINWVRIVLIILAGYLGGMDHPLVHQHVWFGWVVFATLYLPFLWGVMRFLGPARAVPPSSGRGRVAPLRLAAVLAAACVLPLAASAIMLTSDGQPREPFRLPERAGELVRRDAEVVWHPYFADADHLEWTGYGDRSGDPAGDGLLYAFTATYLQQTHGKEVVNLRNNFHGRNWRLARRATAPGPGHEVTELELDGGPGRALLVWYWYRVGGTPVATERAAKLAQVRHKLSGRTDASAIALAAPCTVLGITRDCEAARARLVRLADALSG